MALIPDAADDVASIEVEPDATAECFCAHYAPEINGVVVECWDREDHYVRFATKDPRLLRGWLISLEAAADDLECAYADAEDHICPACNGSGEDPLGPAGEGRCRECHGSGEVTGE